MKPKWINKKINFKELHNLERKIFHLDIRTVCHQARCPNISECFSKNTAAFLLLGDICTRNCRFCNVTKGMPNKPRVDEPQQILEAVKRLKLKYVVLTSVTRDDLADGGASIFADVIKKIKDYDRSIKLEVLTPDFKLQLNAIDTIIKEAPDVFGHNIETVPSLYKIRDGDYRRSLNLLKYISEKKKNIFTKSNILLGFGEKENEVISAFKDLRSVNCDLLTIGQYLRPCKKSCPVVEYIEPEKFGYYKNIAMDLGFKNVLSGAYVRSSYLAESFLEESKLVN